MTNKYCHYNTNKRNKDWYFEHKSAKNVQYAEYKSVKNVKIVSLQ